MPGVLRGANQATAPTRGRGASGAGIPERVQVQAGLSQVRGRIAAAEAAAGRPSGSVRLIAVSKTFDATRSGR